MAEGVGAGGATAGALVFAITCSIDSADVAAGIGVGGSAVIDPVVGGSGVGVTVVTTVFAMGAGKISGAGVAATAAGGTGATTAAAGDAAKGDGVTAVASEAGAT